jgi:uncharacterized membrane protein
MNIHPLFVHFPIALLVVYSFLEIGAYFLPALRRQTWVFGVKVFLLIAGALSALLALATGGMAEDLIQNTNQYAFVLEVHAPFAATTTVVYLVLLAAYLVRWLDISGLGDRNVGTNSLFARIWSFKKSVTHIVLDTWLLPFLALLGFALLTITGGLGAAIVYGPNIDPLVSFVYHLFWAQ